jgi:hypothetical protein
MNYSTSEVAEEIFNELEDDSLSLSNIVTWIRANAGNVSIKIKQEIAITDTGQYSIEINDHLKQVIKCIYFERYYRNKAKNALANAFGQIISMKDDSSSITFTNANEIAKNYYAQAKQYQDELDKTVAGYSQLKSVASSSTAPTLVDSKNTNFYPLR